INDAPTLNGISNVSVAGNSPVKTINLAGISAGPFENQTLTVRATSSNTGLIPNPSVTYSSSGATGSIKFKPAANKSGTATITVRVTDNGSNTAPHKNFIERSFKVTVSSNTSQPDVANFNLINTSTGQVISQIQDGTTLYTSKLPVSLKQLNIDAILSQQFAGSVVFGFNGNPKYSIENYAPYAIAGNTGKTFHNWNNGLKPGKNEIIATTYSSKGGIGTKGKTKTITLTIVDDKVNTAFTGNKILLEENREDIQFELARFWPNPVQDNITISFNAPSENSIKIYINDMKGQLIKSFTSTCKSGSNELQLNLEDLKGGVYTVSLVNQFNKINFRIIKKD
ncbi:MAG: T9SS type A sorting domain-containing protein, partial [Bacteroidota bacterium]|nr:T9SS type A sorting domain-containing protein [Bacteroidota bacterium]